MVHERTLLAPGGENVRPSHIWSDSTELSMDAQAQKILSFLITQLEKETDKEDTSPKILALLGTGIAKLLLCGMVADERASLQYLGFFLVLKDFLGRQEPVNGVLLTLQCRQPGTEAMPDIFRPYVLPFNRQKPTDDAGGGSVVALDVLVPNSMP